MPRILTVVGARPQFVKAASVCRELRRAGFEEILVNTGQHYDRELADLFFEELDIPSPDRDLRIGSGSHGKQTGAMLAAIESTILDYSPAAVVVFGDTNSTLAATLAAAKLKCPVAHIEAGLRSFNREMPEEINRVATDHLSTWLFCPSQVAIANLEREGIKDEVHDVGDVMHDVLIRARAAARRHSSISTQLDLGQGVYSVATIHRAENTDNPNRLRSIMEGLANADHPVIFPAHPRVRDRLTEAELECMVASSETLRVVNPIGYLDMIALVEGAKSVLTDSGGLQKEAFWLKTPCLTLREETEWIETIESGWNRLVPAEASEISHALTSISRPPTHQPLYGKGDASAKTAEILMKAIRSR